MLPMRRKKQAKAQVYPLHVKTGDTVMVISGKDKGKTGTIRKVFADRSKVLVEGVNFIKKATRPNPMAGQQGGIVTMEAPIYASKVMLFCLQCSKPTRIHHAETPDGKKTRVCHHCKAQFDQ